MRRAPHQQTTDADVRVVTQAAQMSQIVHEKVGLSIPRRCWRHDLIAIEAADWAASSALAFKKYKIANASTQVDENLLHRTAGPYSWVKSGRTQSEHNTSGSPLIADINYARPTTPQKMTAGSS